MAGPEHESPAGTAAASPDRRRRRVRRALVGAVVALAALAALAAGAAFWTAGHLDHPWVAPRLRGLASEALGAPVTWDRLALDLASGALSARGLEVGQPGDLAAHAPRALRLDALDGRVDLPALARGALRIDGVRARGLALTLVTTPDADTVSAAWPGDPTDDAPPTPPSATLDALRGLDVVVADLRVEGLELAWVDVDGRGRVTRRTLGPLALEAEAAPAEGALGATLRLGVDGARLEAGLPRRAGAEAPVPSATLAGGATVALEPRPGGGANTSVAVDVELREQSLLPELAAAPAALEAALEVRLLPGEERIDVELTRLSLLGGAVTGALAGVVRDARPDALVDAEGAARLRLDASPWRVPGLELRGVALDLEARGATLAPDGLGGRLAVRGRAARADWAPPPDGAPGDAGAAAGDGRRVAVEGLAIEGALADGGAASLQVEGRAVDVAWAGTRIDADDARVSVAGDAWLGPLLEGGSPVADVTVVAARLDIDAAGVAVRATQLDASARVDLAADRHAGRLAAGRLALRADGDTAKATRVDLAVEAARPLALADVSDAGATLALEGPVARLALPGATLSGARLDLALRRPPGRATYRLDGDVAVAAAVLGGRRLDGARRLEVHGEVDPLRLDGDLHLVLGGPAGPDLELDLAADTAGGGLDYELGLAAARLRPLLALAGLAAGGVSVDRIRVEGGGALAGVVARGPGGARRVASDPGAALRGDQGVEVVVEGVAYGAGDLDVRVPSLRLRARADHRGGGSDVALALAVPRVEIRAGEVTAQLEALSVDGTVGVGPALDASALRFEVRARVGAVDGPWLGPVRARDVTLRVGGTLDPRALRVTTLRLEHAGTGTSLTAAVDWERVDGVAGLADAVPGREALVVEGRLAQDLAPLAAHGLAERARGRLRVPFRVVSGDLVAYDVRLEVSPDAVDLALPGGRWAVEGLSGTVPVTQVVTRVDGGVRLDAGAGVHRLARARFFDVQPFLGGEDWLAADRVVVAGEAAGPVGGNLRVAGTTFALDRLQVAWREGVVAGQLLVDWPTLAGRGRDETAVTFRGNATGIRLPGSDEVLDANGALVLRPASLQLDGTVHVVRVGPAHLRALLDAFDPFHENVSANRIRGALGLGYPEYVRLRVREGTLDAKVDLGGLAGAVRIDEIRAVPIGPLLARWVRPVLDAVWPAPPPPPDTPGGSP